MRDVQKRKIEEEIMTENLRPKKLLVKGIKHSISVFNRQIGNIATHKRNLNICHTEAIKSNIFSYFIIFYIAFSMGLQSTYISY